jgi:hypothetical protein
MAALGPVALAGCVNVAVFASVPVACRTGGEGTPSNGVVLMAQSVPTATWVPCVNPLEPGWRVAGMDARNGTAEFYLDSDRNHQNDEEVPHTIKVVLTESCETEGASVVPPDREGMVRLERVTQINPTYISERYYVFEGGCITLLFTVTGRDRSEPLAVATQVIGTVAREDLRELVREQSGDRLELDPPGSE